MFFFRLHYIPNGREIKIIISESSVQDATTASAERVGKNLIPVFQLTDVEVSKSDKEKLIVYAQKLLSVLDEDYPKFDGQKGEGDDGQVCGSLLRIENMDETFITTDLM